MTLVALLMLLQPDAGVANPSVDQYVESVPTAGGSPAPGGRPAQLPAAVRDRIRSEGGADAATLQAVASSPALGAPASASGTGGHSGGSKPDRSGTAGEPDSPVTAATTTAVPDGGGSSVPVLAGGLILLTAAGAGMALARRRRS